MKAKVRPKSFVHAYFRQKLGRFAFKQHLNTVIIMSEILRLGIQFRLLRCLKLQKKTSKFKFPKLPILAQSLLIIIGNQVITADPEKTGPAVIAGNSYSTRQQTELQMPQWSSSIIQKTMQR